MRSSIIEWLLNSTYGTVTNKRNFDSYFLTYDEWQDKNNKKTPGEQYKLGIGILYACYTSYANSKKRIDAGTNVFSTNGIFWGVPKSLIPPLCPLDTENRLRVFKDINIGVGTVAPKSVQEILDDHKEIK